MAFLCSVFRLQVVRRFFWKSVGCGKRFLQLFLDRTRPFLHRLCRSSSGHERHDIWKPNHHYHFNSRPWWPWSCLLFWNSSSDKYFGEHADRCQFLKRKPGASEGERERERERDCYRGVQMSREADWVPWKTLEHTMIPLRSSVVTWRWAHLSCTLFCIQINCQYVCQEVRKLEKNHAPIFFMFTIKKENTWTIKHMTHTTQLQAHMWHARAHTYVHIHERTHTHASRMHACIYAQSAIIPPSTECKIFLKIFGIIVQQRKPLFLPRKLREAQNNVEICMDLFFSNEKFILSNWTSI